MEFTEAYKQTGPCCFSPNSRYIAVAVDYRLVIRDTLSFKVFAWPFWLFCLVLRNSWWILGVGLCLDAEKIATRKGFVGSSSFLVSISPATLFFIFLFRFKKFVMYIVQWDVFWCWENARKLVCDLFLFLVNVCQWCKIERERGCGLVI